METDRLERLADAFRTFAGECHGSSPLYEALSRRIADDRDLLDLALAIPAGQPPGNLLLAAVHAALLRHGDPELAAFYGSLTLVPAPPDDAFPAFRAFALGSFRDEIEARLATGLVQTNEVRRTIYLASAMARLAREFPGRAFSLIELGASAGLNLRLDRYEFAYEGHSDFGDLGSTVSLRSVARGAIVPPRDLSVVTISGRIGIDLNPLDLRRDEDLLWLRALIWPEHRERREQLDRAAEILREHPVEVVRGDAITDLGRLVGRVPEVDVPFVFHTHVANQMGEAGRRALLDTVETLGRERDLIHVHNDIEPHLHATVFRGGRRDDLPLANVEGHARWVEWLDPA